MMKYMVNLNSVDFWSPKVNMLWARETRQSLGVPGNSIDFYSASWCKSLVST